MSNETNKALAYRFYEQVLNGRQVHIIDEIAAAGYDEHDPLPGQGEGREGSRTGSTYSSRHWPPRSPSRTSSPRATEWWFAGPTAACAAGRSSVAWSLRTATRSAGSMFGRAD